MLINFDVGSFWEPPEYADREYVDDPVTDRLVADVEASLGYELPRAYVALMKFQKGGPLPPQRGCCG